MLAQAKKFLVVVALVCGLTSVGGDLARAERSEAPAASSARSTAKQLVAGNYFTCSLSASGTIRCWGDNTYGQLGNGLTNSAGETSSVAVIGITNAIEIAAGAYHACALLADGRVKCWGYGLYGQLGNGAKGSGSNRSTPTFVSNSDGSGDLSNVTSIAAGYDHTCAIISGGTVRCWGQTSDGALGNGVISGGEGDWSARPVSVLNSDSTPLSSVAEIALGLRFSCALLSDGTGKCWGSNGSGQLGIGDNTGSNARSGYAVAVSVVSSALGLTAGMTHACFITATDVLCAGGAINRYVFGTQISRVTPVSLNESSVRQVVASDNATCILRSDATVRCAGGIYTFENTQTSRADGSAGGPSSTFISISGLSNVVALAAGGEHICAMLTSGMKCWGRNNYGQLGDGSTNGTAVSGLVSVVGIEAATITISDPGAKNVGSAAFDLVASSSSGAAVTLSIDSASSSVCSISGVRVTILDAGSCVVNGVSAPAGIYSAGTGSRTVTVSALGPTVASPAAGSITSTGVTLTVSVNARGASTNVAVEYGTSATLVGATSVAAGDAKTGNAASVATKVLTGLTPGATYYFRFSATNSVGSTVGDIVSFVTSGSKPVVVTGSATRGTAGMTVNGKVNPKDLETSVRFEYGTDPKLAGAQQTAAKSQTGSDDVDVSAVVSGLVENTTYYYRIVATNVVGTAEGDIKSFTTTRPEGVTVNDGDEFTSSENVVVSVVGPSTAVKAILSNDGGFKTSETFDLTNNSADINWKLQSSREGTFTKIVYVKYVSRFGSQSQPVTDDIILDTTKPVMAAATATAAAPTGSAVQVARVGVSAKKASGGVRLSLRGSDTISGIGVVEVRSAANKAATKVTVSRVAGKADGKPRSTSQTVSLKTTAKRLQVRVIDRAGNASAWRTITVK